MAVIDLKSRLPPCVYKLNSVVWTPPCIVSLETYQEHIPGASLSKIEILINESKNIIVIKKVS